MYAKDDSNAILVKWDGLMIEEMIKKYHFSDHSSSQGVIVTVGQLA